MTRTPDAGQRGGVLLRTSGESELVFVPADVATQICALSAVTEVAGLQPPVLGIALAEGRVVTVFKLGTPPDRHETELPRERFRSGSDWSVPGSDRAVLCNLGSEVIALSGGDVIATGLFDPDDLGSGVLWRGARVPRLDVRALYAQAEAAIWAARAAHGGSEARP